MAENVPIPALTWWQGNDISFEILIRDVNGAVVDMTGYTLAWYLWQRKTDTAVPPVALITKSNSDIVKFDGDGTNDGARIPIADTDTINTTELITEGLYYHELWRTDAGNEILLAYGDANLEASPRR